MATKGVLGLTLGQGLRRWLPHRVARVLAVAACVVMGALALWE